MLTTLPTLTGWDPVALDDAGRAVLLGRATDGVLALGGRRALQEPHTPYLSGYPHIAPATWRGRLVGLFQFNVVFGILLAYFSNFVIGGMHFGDLEWRSVGQVGTGLSRLGNCLDLPTYGMKVGSSRIASRHLSRGRPVPTGHHCPVCRM